MSSKRECENCGRGSVEWWVRDQVGPADVAAVREILSSSGFFREDEISVGVELVEETLAKGPAAGYQFVFVEVDGATVGYACFGQIPCSVHSFDLYWIAVLERLRNAGLGRVLLAESEARVARAGGKRVYIETSSRAQYDPTRRFYERCGYRVDALLEDFYAPADGKAIFVKALPG